MPKRKNKYNNHGFRDDDGVWWPSKGEFNRYHELLLLEEAGEIRDLKRQVSFNITIEAKYKADFTYIEGNKYIVEDFKGYPTREYLKKKKAMLKNHGIEIRETGRKGTKPFR